MPFIDGQRQISLSPALWVPVIRDLHSERQHWLIPCSVEDAMEQTWAATRALGDEGFIAVSQDHELRLMNIHFLSKAKWLDKISLSFHKRDSKTTAVAVHNGSSGFLPLIVPGAPLLNLGLAWVPFADGGKCGKTLDVLRRRIDADNDGKISLRIIRYSLTNPKRRAERKARKAKKKAELAAKKEAEAAAKAEEEENMPLLQGD